MKDILNEIEYVRRRVIWGLFSEEYPTRLEIITKLTRQEAIQHGDYISKALDDIIEKYCAEKNHKNHDEDFATLSISERQIKQIQEKLSRLRIINEEAQENRKLIRGEISMGEIQLKGLPEKDELLRSYLESTLLCLADVFQKYLFVFPNQFEKNNEGQLFTLGRYSFRYFWFSGEIDNIECHIPEKQLFFDEKKSACFTGNWDSAYFGSSVCVEKTFAFRKWIFSGDDRIPLKALKRFQSSKTRMRNDRRRAQQGDNAQPPYTIFLVIFEYVDLLKYEKSMMKTFDIQKQKGFNFYTYYQIGNHGLRVYGWAG